MKLLQKYCRHRIEAIELRDRNRDVERDTAVFDHLSLIAIVFVGVALATWAIYEKITPPPSVVETINSNPEKFIQYRIGKMFFSPAANPSAAEGARRFTIELPFRNASGLPGYRKDGIWYEFPISIPPHKFQYGETAVLVPVVWGKSRIFVDRKLHDYGTNHWAIIGISKPNVLLSIKADLSRHPFSTPILATFPILVGPESELRQVLNTIQEQYSTGQFAQYPFLIAITFMGAFYLAYRRRPELFSFLVIMMLSFLYSFLDTSYSSNNSFLGNRDFERLILVTVEFLINSSVFVFSLLFFRVPFNETIKIIKFPIFAIALITLSGSYTLSHLSGGTIGQRQAAHLVSNLAFLLAQIWVCIPELYYLVKKSAAPKLRKASAFFIVCSILAVYSLNLIDYLGLLSTVTTQYRNGYLLYMVLSMFVAFEAARSEGQKRTMAKMMSSEAKFAVEHGKNEVNGKGFVVLVDAIGFTTHERAFENCAEMRIFASQIFEPIAQAIEKINRTEISLLNTTGDGLYFAIKGPPTPRNLNLALTVANEIVILTEKSKIALRVALGYGSYSVFVLDKAGLQREVVFGRVLNNLSRIIGGNEIRILLNPEIKQLISNVNPKYLRDKHGFEHEYCVWGVSEQKAA